MDIVRVRHPETGQVTPIGRRQFETRLARRGFTLAEGESAAGDAPPQGSGDPLTDALGEAIVADALREAGYGDAAAIRAATDEELLAVKGVGPARLEKLRAFATAETEEANQ